MVYTTAKKWPKRSQNVLELHVTTNYNYKKNIIKFLPLRKPKNILLSIHRTQNDIDK